MNISSINTLDTVLPTSELAGFPALEKGERYMTSIYDTGTWEVYAEGELGMMIMTAMVRLNKTILTMEELYCACAQDLAFREISKNSIQIILNGMIAGGYVMCADGGMFTVTEEFWNKMKATNLETWSYINKYE